MATFNEIQERYAVVGGTCSEYCAYLTRKDVDQTLWNFTDGSDVKAVAGFQWFLRRTIRSARS